MYYSKEFYITNPVWNNAFSFEKRENKKLYIPNLIKAKSLDEIKLWDKIVFEDFDFDWKLQSCFWLKNFYEFDLNVNWKIIKLFLFDNHNHAYYFWHYTKFLWQVKNSSNLYHIDEHSDLRDPEKYLEKNEIKDLENIFYYSNYFLNVGNYIIPAQKDWLIDEITQIRNEENLINFCFRNNLKTNILNLDLDFFQPDLDYINYNLKKEVIYKILKEADLITVATSPFFINQNLALKVFKDLFREFI